MEQPWGDEDFDEFQRRIGNPLEHICAAFERVGNADVAADDFDKFKGGAGR